MTINTTLASVLLGLVAVVGAQESEKREGVRSVGKREGVVEKKDLSGRGDPMGVFIGVNCFSEGAEFSLRYAASDAIALCHLFVVEKEWIDPARAFLLLDQNAKNGIQSCHRTDSPQLLNPIIKSYLETLQRRGVTVETAIHTKVIGAIDKAASGGGPLILAFSTHGLEDAESVYLMPADFLSTQPENTGIALNFIIESLQKNTDIPKLVIFDACREVPKQDLQLGKEFFSSIRKLGDANTTVLASCDSSQFSREFKEDNKKGQHGVYTFFLLEALKSLPPTLSRDNNKMFQRVVHASSFAVDQVKWWSFWRSIIDGGGIFEQTPRVFPPPAVSAMPSINVKETVWPGESFSLQVNRIDKRLQRVENALSSLSTFRVERLQEEANPMKYIYWGLESLKYWRPQEAGDLRKRFNKIGKSLLSLPFSDRVQSDPRRFDQELFNFRRLAEEQELLRGLQEVLQPWLEFNFLLNDYKVKDFSNLDSTTTRMEANSFVESAGNIVDHSDPRFSGVRSWLQEVRSIPFHHQIPLREMPRESSEFLAYQAYGFILRFKRIEPINRSVAPFYLSTTEIPVGLTLEWIKEKWPDNWKKDMWRNSPNREGIVTWQVEEERNRISKEWILSAKYAASYATFPRNRLTNRPQFEYVPQEPPTGQSPLNQITGHQAKRLAQSMGFRLPTIDEWQAAYAYWKQSDGQPTNVRDSQWEKQRRYLEEEAKGGAVPWPDDGIFTPNRRRASREIASAKDDGYLWLANVSGPAYGGLSHLEGNVAEFLYKPQTGMFYIVGGSALSSPETRTDQPYPLKRSQMRKRFSDVGLRLCRDLLPGEKLEWFIEQWTYFKPTDTNL